MDDRVTVGRRYGEHLTDQDLVALAGNRRDQVPALRRHPDLVLDLLDRPAVADAVLSARQDHEGRFRHVSPFLVFAAAVHRTAGALVGRASVPDRTAPRSRLPVLDAPLLAAFAAAPEHRLFLAELLASYARLTSGTVWQRDEHGWRRRRFDDLDLPRLAERLEATPGPERPGVWRRIGDGALFLAGVFPEHAERTFSGRGLSGLQRFDRSVREGPVVDLLEGLAGRAYGRAGSTVPVGVRDEPHAARRILTLVADRYLHTGRV